MELGYGVSAETAYDRIYGKGASGSQAHAANFYCASNYTKALMNRVDVFSDKLIELRDVRNSAILDQKNGFLTLQRGKVNKIIQRYKRHLTTRGKINKELVKQKNNL